MKCKVLIPDLKSTSKGRLYKVGEIIQMEDEEAKLGIVLGYVAEVKPKAKKQKALDSTNKSEGKEK